MLPRLPFEIIIKIIPDLDYRCYPKILRVNRDIREWILDNWLKIRARRPCNWNDNIPEAEQKRINELYVSLAQYEIRSATLAKVLLLKGAQLDYQDGDGLTCFANCMFRECLEVADVGN
jgi:hypothetical protein